MKKKPDTKGPLLYDSIYVEISRISKSVEKNKAVGSCWGWRVQEGLLNTRIGGFLGGCDGNVLEQDR